MNELVVVGVDGSPQSEAAVRWAAGEAQSRGAALQMVHAWSRHARGARDVQMRGASVQRAEADGRAVLDIAAALARQAAPDVDVRERLVPGSPAQTLVDAAGDAALIVVGIRGRGGFASLLLGSTSQRVAAHATCPVVVLGRQPAYPPAGRVVLGLNVHKAAGASALFAFDAAARADAELQVVYGWAVDDTYARLSQGAAFNLDELRAQQQLALAEALKPWADALPLVKVVQLAVDATADAALVAASEGADLLVVGAHRPHGGPRHLGPIAHNVLRHATCPIAVIPEV